jgi:uncharacterized protein YjbI with pentapeptide repeats
MNANREGPRDRGRSRFERAPTNPTRWPRAGATCRLRPVRIGAVRFLLPVIVALMACAPAAAACAPDSGPNLSNRVVASADLTKYSSLECVNFQHADLRGISFLQADLKTADFRYAIVTGDDFSQATLEGSNFYGARAARADFGQAMMQYANLNDADLQGAQFVQTYLQHATLTGSNTSGADFTQADIYESTGIPSGSGSFPALILIPIGLLIIVPIVIVIWRSSRSK